MRPQIGLALGSGVARGWAHIGVLRALEQAGLKPDIVAGTSIGALVGATYLGGHLPDLEAWALKLSRTRLSRLFDFQLGGGGLIAGRRVLQALHPEMLALAIEDLPVPFICVATDLANGHEVWLRSGNLVEALRASYAVPALFPPVSIDGRWLIDGALANPVPVSVCRAMGAHLTIAVNLSGEAFGESSADEVLDIPGAGNDEARNGDGADADPAPAVRMQFLRQFFRRRDGEPSAFAVMARTFYIVQDRIARSRLAGDPPDLMIFPQLSGIGILDFDRARESIAAGEAATRAALPKLRQLVRHFGKGHAAWNKRPAKGKRPLIESK